MKCNDVVIRRTCRVGRFAVAIGVAAFAACTALADVLVTPVAATAQSAWRTRTADQTINGNGMSPLPVTEASTTSSGADGMWLSSGTRDTWIAFDLGSVRTVTGILVWNYNEVNEEHYQRGVKSCELRYGDSMPANDMTHDAAGDWGTLAKQLTFTVGTGMDGLAGQRIMFDTPLTTRYIMLRVLDNYSTSEAYTGLAEVRFYATARTCLTPVSATAQSYFGSRPPADAINGSGMSPLPVTGQSIATNDANAMWLSNRTRETWIAFDLGDTTILTGAHVWNYNEAPDETHDYCKRGISTCELRYGDSMPTNGMTYADAGNWGTKAEELTLACGTGAGGYRGEEITFAAPFAARYVMLRVLSNHNGDNSYTGLAEIRFYPKEFQCIAPVAATSENHYGARAPVNAVDGSGLSDPTRPSGTGVTHGTDSNRMWESNKTKPTWITFDLGAEREITGFHLWNFNEKDESTSHIYSLRGVWSASIYVGSTLPEPGTSLDRVGEAWGTHVQDMTFLQATMSANYTGENYFFNAPVRGRYLQFRVNENFSPEDKYVGLSEIVFYESAGEDQVTRGSSGAKVIVDAPSNSVSIVDGTGDAAPITLGAETTAIKKLRVLATDGVAQVRPDGNTLAVTDIEVWPDRPGLEILSGGTLTCAGGVRNWMRMALDSDLKIGSPVVANSYGDVNIVKTGEGTLTFDGVATSTDEIAFSGGTCVFSGGMSVASVANTFTDSCAVVGDGHVADWKTLQFDGASSLAVTNGGVLRVGAVDGAATAFSLFIDGGTIATSSTGSNGKLIPALGYARLGDGGATFDTSNGSAVLETAITNETGSITKTGANTLTLARHVSTTGTVTVAEGTLALDIAPVIHYDFDTYSGSNVKNLGSGGSAYDGVVSGAPTTVEGVAGNAMQFSSATNGVATANTISLRNYTYATWVKCAGNSSKSQRIIIGGVYASDTPFLGYLGAQGNNLWNFVLKASERVSSVVLSDDTENWHHIASTYDGYTLKLYYDGELIQQVDKSYDKSVRTMKIGFGNNVTPNDEYFHGAMDEAYVFDRALTAEEVALLKDKSWKELNVLSPDCDLVIGASATLDLGSTDQTVKTLTIGSTLRCRGETTWGAPGSGAAHESARITGSGILRVLGPEPCGTVLIVR